MLSLTMSLKPSWNMAKMSKRQLSIMIWVWNNPRTCVRVCMRTCACARACTRARACAYRRHRNGAHESANIT